MRDSLKICTTATVPTASSPAGMARAPPVNLFRPPDQSHLRRFEETNKTHQESPSNSSYNFTKLRNTEAMNIAISERELEGIHKFISLDRDKLINRKLFSGNDSTNQGLQHTQKLHDSIAPIARSDEATSGKIRANSPERRLQIRPTSYQFYGDLTIGDCSPSEEVHLTEISSKMAGQITDDKNSGEPIVEDDDGDIGGNCSLDEEVHLTNISSNLAQEHSQNKIQTSFINSTTNPQIELEEPSCRIEEQQQETFFHDQARPNGQKQDHNAIGEQQIEMESTQIAMRVYQGKNDQLGNTSSTNLEVIDVENSSYFSFGVKPMDTTPNNGGQQRPGMIPKYHNEPSHVYMQEQQQTNNTSLSKNPSMESTQAGKSSNSNSSTNVVTLSSSGVHVNDSPNRQKNLMREEQGKGKGDTETQQQVNRHQSRVRDKNLSQPTNQGGNTEPNNYHKDFPKLSRNFDRHISSNQQSQQINQSNQSKEPNNPNENHNTKHDQSVEPAPYTVVQTLAARLRQIHATQTTSIELVPPKHTTK
ncbi:uncharacterized protein LOC125831499 [Solanum verrucosum]|uniref:uncharacterized protein LOC125831499 n=1 Tax=Solanum verrucosum TaxID=315347 RepID=UPI0020CFF831|nr:uncharacterized protein LOC125831499 [Solanum verrucosum]